MDSRTTEWIKASGGGSDGPYVEMRRHGDRIEVRNSQEADAGPVLSFTLPSSRPGWTERSTGSSTTSPS